MPVLRLLLATALMTLLGATPAAALYKCSTAGGGVSYQQTPCITEEGLELQPSDRFGLTEHVALPPETAMEPVHGAAGMGKTSTATAGQTASGKTIYIGPRGGRYTLTESGRKNYLPKAPTDAGPATAAPHQTTSGKEMHIGARGGCYTLGATGRKNYLPREQCPTP